MLAYRSRTSRLARCLTTILPAMPLAEAIETTRIPRVAGLTGERTALLPGTWVALPYHSIFGDPMCT
jgi:predicted ATPase with chaperone activity